MKIALCSGHHAFAKGAVNKKFGLNEHDEAKKVVRYLSDILQSKGHIVSIFSGKLSRKISNINNGNFDLALDIHFNAGGGHGCEVICVPKNNKRKAQAMKMSDTISSYMQIHDRGAKEGYWMGGSHPGTRPDAFVSQTNCAAFIPEQIFIDDDAAVERWFVTGKHKDLAHALAHAIDTL